LLITIRKNDLSQRYVGSLADFRGSVEMTLHRLDCERAEVGPAWSDDAGLTKEELGALDEHLIEYFANYGQRLAPFVDDFYRCLRSERLVYGLRSGVPFEHHYETQRAYDLAVAATAREMASTERRWETQRREALLREIEHSDRPDSRPPG